jgi:glycosyltransferase involved in cell wall biosynthesis
MELVEKSMTHRADRVMTVCDSIAQHMSETLRIPVPRVVRNVPVYELVTHQDISPLREIASIARDVPIILNLGMISHGRGIETLLNALQRIEPPAMAVFLGSADTSATPRGKPTYLESLRTLAQQLGVADRVRFVPSVPPEDVHFYTMGGTIGVAPIEPTCLSYCYCLPNKLFQYIQAGLPVVTSDLPEMARVVRQYKIGEVFPPGDSRRLAAAIDSLLNDPAKLKLCQQNSANAAQELNWNKEQAKLIAIYEQLNGMNSPVSQECA